MLLLLLLTLGFAALRVDAVDLHVSGQVRLLSERLLAGVAGEFCFGGKLLLLLLLLNLLLCHSSCYDSSSSWRTGWPGDEKASALLLS